MRYPVHRSGHVLTLAPLTAPAGFCSTPIYFAILIGHVVPLFCSKIGSKSTARTVRWTWLCLHRFRHRSWG
uniref:Replication-associated protein n=1 Tax=Phoenicopteridae CRESS-DNA-virus sp. TaxID=2815051 RepID=A0A8A4XCR7_9VIRU|nr:MAG: replication-associated protein [Phoenicopteridae CRESS-DNA-virus sp.]